MFKKLLSNLPFNPSLVEQVAFYAKRLHREAFLRTAGIVIMVLAVIVQAFAAFSPPQASAAINGNDLIPGGFTAQSQAVDHCNANDWGYRDILAPYSIGCASIAGGHTVYINSNDYNRTLFSMGRIPYNKAGEEAVHISAGTFYMRYLWSWDTGHSNTYKAITGTNLNGVPFFILYDCGNLVLINQKQPAPLPPPPAPPAPKPVPKPTLPCAKSTSPTDTTSCLILRKTARNETQGIMNANGTTAAPGDYIVYTLSVQNTGTVTVKNFPVKENIEDILEYADVTDYHGGKIAKDKTVSWPPKNILGKATISQQLTVRIKNPLPNTPRSTSNPGSYDLLMTNVYGTTVNIRLPNSPVKTAEIVTQTLPNTGPGTSLFIGFGVTTIIGYFVARSRLMAKELDIAKRDAVSVGGN